MVDFAEKTMQKGIPNPNTAHAWVINLRPGCYPLQLPPLRCYGMVADTRVENT